MVVLSLLLACPTPACPPGTAAIAALEARVMAPLEREALPPPRAVCFAPGAEPAITAAGLLRLDPGWTDAANTARAAHLLLHRRQGLAPTTDCARWHAAEAEARALESRLRADAGLSDPLPPPLDSPPPLCDAERGGPP